MNFRIYSKRLTTNFDGAPIHQIAIKMVLMYNNNVVNYHFSKSRTRSEYCDPLYIVTH